MDIKNQHSAQTGLVSPLMLLAIAAVAVLGYVVLTSFAPFSNPLSSSLYPKTESEARGSKSGSSYSLTLSPEAPYYFGQQVYTTTNEPTSMYPGITMNCYQNGVLVGQEQHAAWPGGWYYNLPFTMGPSAQWTAGEADCTFSLVHTSGKRQIVDTTISIHVYANK